MEEIVVTVEQEVNERSDFHFKGEFEPLKTITPVKQEILVRGDVRDSH
jgi:hypothetical protein